MLLSKFRPSVVTSTIKHHKRSVTTSVTSEKVGVSEDVPLKPWKEIPGPKSLPVIGILHHFLPGGQFYNLNGLNLIKKLFETYGPIVRLDAFVNKNTMIILADAECASQVLRGENWRPIRPLFTTLQYYRENVKKGAIKGRPGGLITDNGEAWKELRSAVNPVFLQPKTVKLYASILDEIAQDMVVRMKSRRDEKNMLKGKFEEEMHLWSLESIGVVALGCRLGCFEPNLPEDSRVKQLIDCGREIFAITEQLEFRPTFQIKMVTKPIFKRIMRLFELKETLTKYFINEAMKGFKTNEKSNDKKGILEKLLEINEDFAHIMVTDMLFAGVDTVANSIAPTLYLLAVNPEKQTKLREELRSNDEKRPYLKACFKEAMRMMPVLNGNLRLTTKDYDLLGYRIPTNMRVSFCHQYMAGMEENYLRAKEYHPERWLVGKDDPLSYRNAHPFAFSVFGYGVRSCIGRRIAELEIETFIARLVENFEIRWFGPPPEVEHSSINYLKEPFKFIFNDAPKM